MKSFNDFLTESDAVKPVVPVENIPKKLPPKKKMVKKPKIRPNVSNLSAREPKDTVESPPQLGFKPYTRNQ